MLARKSTSKFSAASALRFGVMTLQTERIESASLDARLLLQYVLGVTREALLLSPEAMLSREQEAQYRALISKRGERQPIAQLIQKREFWGMEFRVTEDTLDPRPDSETLVENVLQRIKNRDSSIKVLDFGTGTGCLLLALLKELPNAQGIGAEVCEKALVIAKENAKNLGFGARAQFVRSHWAENISGMFDVIVANPPYIPTGIIPTLDPEVSQFEPNVALDGGVDGMSCYRQIMKSLPQLLKKDGFAAFEIGMGQEKAVEEIARANGLKVAEVKTDLAGIARSMVFTH